MKKIKMILGLLPFTLLSFGQTNFENLSYGEYQENWALIEKGGLLGFVEMLTFVAFLLIGFYYIIKKGALKWE